MKDMITLSDGSGGKEMNDLIDSFAFTYRGRWKGFDDDSSMITTDEKNVFFTTDSFIVDPLFFPDSNIGHLAFCGTINDLLAKGARPIGISLALVIEEGLEKEVLKKIINTIDELSSMHKVPIATGDTKVMPKGKIDKLMINTSGIGTGSYSFDQRLLPGDSIIITGGLGEHAISILSQRFDFETDIVSDTRPLISEIRSIARFVKQAKDPTRGGLAAVLNELAEKNSLCMQIDIRKVPAKKAVHTLTKMLGIDMLTLASEGRMIVIVDQKDEKKVLEELRKFNEMAACIGTVTKGKGVLADTGLGIRKLPMPTGRIVPRIC